MAVIAVFTHVVDAVVGAVDPASRRIDEIVRVAKTAGENLDVDRWVHFDPGTGDLIVVFRASGRFEVPDVAIEVGLRKLCLQDGS